MNLSAIHKLPSSRDTAHRVVCDIGGYEFVSYSQAMTFQNVSVPSCL